MDELEKRKFELHSQTDGYQEKVDQAERYVNKIFERYDNPHIEFSGGKDSLVLLHLVVQKCGYTDTDVYHFENELLKMPGVTEFVKYAVEEIGGNLVLRSGNEAKEGRVFWATLAETFESRDWSVRVMGIRADESSQRRDRVDKNSDIPLTRKERFDAAFPIHDLSARDIWSYIVVNQLPYHSLYDEQAELYGGMEHESNRLSMFLNESFDSLGLRQVSQFLHPEKMNLFKHLKQIDEQEDGTG